MHINIVRTKKPPFTIKSRTNRLCGARNENVKVTGAKVTLLPIALNGIKYARAMCAILLCIDALYIQALAFHLCGAVYMYGFAST